MIAGACRTSTPAMSTTCFSPRDTWRPQDRLWQLDMWRRWLEGRTAEVAGPERFEADRMMRLLSWRGGLSDEELDSYHPQTERILAAFVAGLNAFIEDSADDLPVEFKLTGLRPEPWTTGNADPEVDAQRGRWKCHLRSAARPARRIDGRRGSQPAGEPRSILRAGGAGGIRSGDRDRRRCRRFFHPAGARVCHRDPARIPGA